MSWAEMQEYQIYAAMRMKGASKEKAMEVVEKWRAYEQLCDEKRCYGNHDKGSEDKG